MEETLVEARALGCPECGSPQVYKMDQVENTEIWDCLNEQCGAHFHKKLPQKLTKMDVIGFIGTALTAVALLLLGSSSITGWLIAITGSIIWIAYAFSLRLYPILTINILIIIIDVRGFLLWLH